MSEPIGRKLYERTRKYLQEYYEETGVVIQGQIPNPTVELADKYGDIVRPDDWRIYFDYETEQYVIDDE